MHVFGQACHAHRSASLPTGSPVDGASHFERTPQQRAGLTLLGSSTLAPWDMSSSIQSNLPRWSYPPPQMASCSGVSPFCRAQGTALQGDWKCSVPRNGSCL